MIGFRFGSVCEPFGHVITAFNGFAIPETADCDRREWPRDIDERCNRRCRPLWIRRICCYRRPDSQRSQLEAGACCRHGRPSR